MGPWWMSVNKLDVEVQELRGSLEGLSDPRLAYMPALIRAWGALAEAEGAMRKVSPQDVPSTHLGSAIHAVAVAGVAVRQVQDLMVRRGTSDPRPVAPRPAAIHR
jgi:hypothetical protein